LKNGDAKPWVYNCKRSHDSQVAEEKFLEHLRKPGDINQARFFGTLSFVRSIKANPLKSGDAKPRI
jgi:hypothetical protein